MKIKKTKFIFFNNRHHLNDQGISLFVDALKLNRVKQVPDDIRAHVETCHRCRMEIMGLYGVVREQDYSDQGIHPFLGEGAADFTAAEKKSTGLKAGEWKFIFRIAAVIIIFIALGLYVFWGKLSPGRSNKIIAENFTPSPNLENLVNESYRAYSVEVLSPENGRNYSRAINFRWESDYVGPFFLKILNNRENIVREFTVRENQFHFKEKLPRGLYYWKLETEEELLYIGKFYVGKPE